MLLLQRSHFFINKLERLPGCIQRSQVSFEASVANPLVLFRIKLKVVAWNLDVYVI